MDTHHLDLNDELFGGSSGGDADEEQMANLSRACKAQAHSLLSVSVAVNKKLNNRNIGHAVCDDTTHVPRP